MAARRYRIACRGPPTSWRSCGHAWRTPRGWRVLSTVNNTNIGLAYIATALLFFVLAGVLALLMRAQLALPESTLLSPRLYNQIFTMHGTVMMFLFAVPIVEAVAVYLLPGMLGARDLPFPRLSAYAYWAYALGGPRILLHDLLRRGSRRRLVHVSAADQCHLLARARRRLLAAGHRLHRDLRDRRRHRTHRRHPVHACSRNVTRADAGIRVGHAGGRLHDRLRVPGHHRGHRAARTRTRIRLAHLRCTARRRSAAVAAPLLVLRPSRGLHHLPAGGGHGVDDPAGGGSHRARRLPRGGRRDRCRRLSELCAVGASHVHRRSGAMDPRAGLGGQPRGGHTQRRPGVRLDRDAGTRAPAVDDQRAVPAGLSRHLRDRRPDRRHGRGAALRRAGARHLLRRRAPALRADRRHGVPGHRRPVPLAAAGQRSCDVGAARRAGRSG